MAKTPEASDPSKRPRFDAARIVLLVRQAFDAVPLPGRPTVDEIQDALDAWPELLRIFPELRLQSVFDDAQLARLRIAVRQALARAGADKYVPPPFDRYYYVTGVPEQEVDFVALRLRQLRARVERAYVDRPAPPSAPPPAAPQGLIAIEPGDLGYLGPAPLGTGAAAARKLGFDGTDQCAIDLEQGWTFEHVGIQVHDITSLAGTINDDYRNHGTSVLGILCAEDRGPAEPVGIAPKVASIRTVAFDGESTRHHALEVALSALKCGDTLLLEAQIQLKMPNQPGTLRGPIEANVLDFQLIQTFTAKGIIVVEAAGNGNELVDSSARAVNLDEFLDDKGAAVLQLGVRDSEAILVSAASRACPHTRMPYASYGPRVDCYAWGECIYALASTPLGDIHATTKSFGGTSGASAIIAGLTLQVQQWAEQNHGKRIDSETMRRILSDPAFGTGPKGGEKPIGSMPNVEAIVTSSTLPPPLLVALPCVVQGQT